MRPALEVADIVRAHGDEFRQAHAASLSQRQKRVLRSIELCRTAALGGHLERCDQCTHERNAYNYLPEPALSKVPDASARTLARCSRARASRHQLLPCRVHRAARTQCAGAGQPASVLRPVVHCQRTNIVESSTRSQTPWCGNRCDQHSAYLGTEPAAPSAHSLRHSSGRPVSRPQPLDTAPLSFLPAGEGS